MIQGTTPTHIFKISIGTETIRSLRITYCQCGQTVIEKTENDVEMRNNAITLTLTQEETLRLNPRWDVKLQVKILTFSGVVMASRIKELSVSAILNEEILL